jgi:hypothetical protein
MMGGGLMEFKGSLVGFTYKIRNIAERTRSLD